MRKRILMVVGLAAFMGASMACFGLFSRKPAAERPVVGCEELEGPARADCERRAAEGR
jgi:hypothetical protein